MDKKIIERPQIAKKLSNIFSYPLSIIHAPMGYGKTTAVREFLIHKDVDLVWVSLAGSGGSVDYLWSHAAEQMIKLENKLGRPLKKIGFPYDMLKTEKVIDLLIDNEQEKPLVLVFDDFQVIDDKRVFSLIQLIVRQKVEYLHIVLITRDLSKIDAAGLYQNQLCFTLTEKALKLTRKEVEAYFDVMDCPVCAGQIDSVYRYTDGWISMVYIMLKSIQRGLPAEPNSTVNDIIEQNFFNVLDEKSQEVLLKLSFLETFTVPMALAVLQDEQASLKLQEIIRSNTFLLYHELDQHYTIRNLLDGYLHERAKFANIDFNLLYTRAGQWYLNQKEYSNAFDFLYRAGRIEMILQELNRENTPDIQFTQFVQMHRIFDGLSEALCLTYPIAYLQYLRICAMSGDAGALIRCQENLQKMERYVNDSAFSEGYKRFILGEINVVSTFVAFNDLEKMSAHNRKAVLYFSGGCSCIVTRKKEFTFGSPHLLCCYYSKPGSLCEIAHFLSEQCDSLMASIDGCGTGCDCVALAEYALETGAYDNVETYAYKALYKAKSAEQICLMICAQFVLARLSIFRGTEESAKLMSQLQEEVLRENNPILNTTFDLCNAYLEACLGHATAIPAWVCNGNRTAASFLYQGKQFYYVVYQKAVLLSGDMVKLEALCETSMPHFSHFHNQLCILHTAIHAAIAKKKLYGMESGCNELKKALSIGIQDHIILPFAENSAHLLDMMERIRRSEPIYEVYLKELMEHCRMYLARLTSLQNTDVLLTGREREILQLLGKGYKHEEIGTKLYISVTTVRFHIKNIYQKLNVNNKVLAIQKAQKMHLL